MKLFLDTSAFIALEDRSESRHLHAKRYFEQLTVSDRLFTSSYVVDETITRLRYTIGAAAAMGFAETVLKGRLYSVLYIDARLEQAGLGVLKRFRDKKLSFTDCTTIALVQAERLDAVFAFDDDFAKVGLRVVPGPN